MCWTILAAQVMSRYHKSQWIISMDYTNASASNLFWLVLSLSLDVAFSSLLHKTIEIAADMHKENETFHVNVRSRVLFIIYLVYGIVFVSSTSGNGNFLRLRKFIRPFSLFLAYALSDSLRNLTHESKLAIRQFLRFSFEVSWAMNTEDWSKKKKSRKSQFHFRLST